MRIGGNRKYNKILTEKKNNFSRVFLHDYLINITTNIHKKKAIPML